jgi:concanavalin A-like lectin/glucanase superfamily protein
MLAWRWVPGKESSMKRFTFAMLALLVSVCASIRVCDAAQMALKLDGVDADSFFAAPNSPSLAKDIGSNLTVEAWINPAANVADDTNHPANEYLIVNKEDSYEIAVTNTSDPTMEGTFQVALRPADSSDGTAGSWGWNDSGVTIPVHKWTHVAATWDGMTIRTFVNGKFAMSFDWAGPDGNKGTVADGSSGSSGGLATLKVGRRGRGDTTHSIFNGLIDEVRISKVIRYTEAGFTVPAGEFTADADTVALYHFDEASTAAADIKALQDKFAALGPTHDAGAGNDDPPLVVVAVVKDASSYHNDGALTKNAVLVPADTPITVTPAPQ